MVVLKIKFGDDIRRLTVQNGTLTNVELRELLCKLFAQKEIGDDFVVKYVDEEGDLVTITSDEELKEAIGSAQRAILRLEIQVPEKQTPCDATRERRRCRRALMQQKQQPSTEQKREEPEQADKPVQHHAICDSCNNVIVGIRFKCGNCPDYDLCEDCESRAPSVHDPLHVFLKVRAPIQLSGRRCLLPDLHNSRPFPRFGAINHFGLPHAPPPPPGFVPTPASTHDGEQQRQPPFPGCHARRWGGRCGGRGRHWQKLMRMQSRFIKDVTIEDATVMPPGQSFVKIWSVNNCGEVAWPAGTRLVHVAGDTLSTEPSVIVSESEVPSGETVEISINMVAPQAEGRYVSNWRLCTPRRGFPFGQRVWADIIVKQGADAAVSTPVQREEEAKTDEGSSSPLLKLRMVSAPPEHKAEEEEKKSNEGTSPLLKLRMASPQAQVEEKKPTLINDFEEGLEQLAAMGFGDKELNARILAKRRGNMCAAVQDLLALQ